MIKLDTRQLLRACDSCKFSEQLAFHTILVTQQPSVSKIKENKFGRHLFENAWRIHDECKRIHCVMQVKMGADVLCHLFLETQHQLPSEQLVCSPAVQQLSTVLLSVAIWQKFSQFQDCKCAHVTAKACISFFSNQLH